MGQIRGVFRSDFSVFGASAPNALKSDLKKLRICPIWSLLLAHRAKMFWNHWNLIWESPGFVPFVADLTHFKPKRESPGFLYRRPARHLVALWTNHWRFSEPGLTWHSVRVSSRSVCLNIDLVTSLGGSHPLQVCFVSTRDRDHWAGVVVR